MIRRAHIEDIDRILSIVRSAQLSLRDLGIDQWQDGYPSREVIEADISIKTQRTDLQVWGVNAEGFYAGRVPTTYEDGWLQFEVGDINNPAAYYLIVKE